MTSKILNKPDLLAGSGDCKTHFKTPRTPTRKPFVKNTQNIHKNNFELELDRLELDTPKTPKKVIPAKITPRKRSQTMTDFLSPNKKSDSCNK